MTLEQALSFVENHIKGTTFNDFSWCAKTAMAVMAEELKLRSNGQCICIKCGLRQGREHEISHYF